MQATLLNNVRIENRFISTLILGVTNMFILFMVVMTVIWAAMFVLPLVAYAALGVSLLKSEKTGKNVKINRSRPVLHLKVSHA